jgi:nucleoside-diphosphate-sugar epimerase
MPDDRLTVAVTGATGTVGCGLLPLLETERRVRRVVAISTRPWSPAAGGFRKVEHRRADVRDRVALAGAFAGADVVVHLAFSLYGVRQSPAQLEAVNVGGTRNAVAAAVAAGARRFVFTSSAAVYGFDERRPALVSEDVPVAPEPRLFYSRHKAAAEAVLREAVAGRPELEWAVFRPCAVVGPDAIGAAAHGVPRPLGAAAAALAAIAGSAGLRPPLPAPPVPLQFVHERDVGRALLRAVTGPAPRATYNLGGDGLVPGDEVPSLLGLRALPIPRRMAGSAVRTAARLPSPWPALSWVNALRQTLELDTTRARDELGWTPRHSSRDALAATRRALQL